MPAFAIGHKGEARTIGSCASSGSYIQEVALVMKVKLGHLLRMRYCSKVLARTLSLCASWVPKAKVGHCACVSKEF